jgi:hypothetical protein
MKIEDLKPRPSGRGAITLISQGKGKAPMADRGADSYPSPPVAVQALMSVERLPKAIWEPACGDGSGMVLPMRASGRTVLASDVTDRGCPVSFAHCFLSDIAIPGLEGGKLSLAPQAIVTNPPYEHADAFILRALSLAPEVYMLMRLTYLEGLDGKKRYSGDRSRILERSGLRRVWVFRERLPALHREGWEGPKVPNPTAYAWLCWRQGYRGKAEIKRLSCRDVGPALEPQAPKRPKHFAPLTRDMFEAAE